MALSWSLHEVVVKMSAGLQVTRRLTGWRICFHSGSLVCLTSWCWSLAGSFSPLLCRRLHDMATWLLLKGVVQGSARQKPQWLLTEPRTSHTVTSSVLYCLPGQPYSVWTPGGKDHWDHLGGWLSQEHNLWDPSSASYELFTFSHLWSGHTCIGWLQKYMWLDIKYLVHCSVLNKCSTIC